MTAYVSERAQQVMRPAWSERRSILGHQRDDSGNNFQFVPLLRRRLMHVVALGLAKAASDILLTYPTLVDSEGGLVFQWSVMLLINKTLEFRVLVGVLTAIQAWTPGTRWRLLVMIAAVIPLAAGTAAFENLELLDHALGIQGISILLGADKDSLFLYFVWGMIAFGGLLAILYEWQARTEQVMEAVRAAGIAGEVVERKILDSRLSSLKARVDPEFLYSVIARTQTLYGEKIDAAEQLLERLIEFLRASLPHSRELTVTIEEEVLLCRAYLELEKALRLDSFSYETRTDAALSGSYFPPSVLLPLLQAVLPPLASPVRHVHFSIIAERQTAGVRVELTCHAVSPPPPDQALDAACTALRAFYGERVSVVAVPAPFTGRTIRIEVPHAAT